MAACLWQRRLSSLPRAARSGSVEPCKWQTRPERTGAAHDPEKCEAVFGQDYAK